MTPPIVHRFRECVVKEWPDASENGVLVTCWPDGRECSAARDCTMQNVDYAASLGYTSVRAALREHELAHTFLAENMGHPYSPTLRAVAENYGPGTIPYDAQIHEESVVLQFQRFLNTQEVGAALEHPAVRCHLGAWAWTFAERFRSPSPVQSEAA
jgi:hypothetical protein